MSKSRMNTDAGHLLQLHIFKESKNIEEARKITAKIYDEETYEYQIANA
jgi:hypothetical protein